MFTEHNIIQIKKQILIPLIIFMVIIAIIFLTLKNNNYTKKIETLAAQNSTEINENYSKELEQLFKSYALRLESISSFPKILNNFEKNNSEALYNSTIGVYERLKKENKYLKIMHFHNAKNITVLRMHKPKKKGDDLSKLRPLIANTNLFLKTFSGLEIGKHGLYFRIAKPSFSKDQSEHIGAIELGIELDYLINILKNYYPSNSFGFLIGNEHIKIKTKALKNLGDNYLFEKTSFFNSIYSKIDLNKKYSIVVKNNKTYIITHDILLQDYQDQNIGTFLNALDITDIKDKHYNEILQILAVWLLLFIILIFIVNYGLDQFIKKFESLKNELHKKFEEIQNNQLILEKYTIYSETDLHGKITHVSDAFCQISGFTKEELLGKSHNIVRHEDMPSETYEELWSLLKAGQYWEGEIKNKTKTGGYYWVKAYITPKLNTSNEVIGYRAVRKDITLEKKLLKS